MRNFDFSESQLPSELVARLVMLKYIHLQRVFLLYKIFQEEGFYV